MSWFDTTAELRVIYYHRRRNLSPWPWDGRPTFKSGTAQVGLAVPLFDSKSYFSMEERAFLVYRRKQNKAQKVLM